MIRKLILFLLIYCVVLILYHPALVTYFSQDDFFHFKVSQTNGSLSEFGNLLLIHPFSERQIAFYRPISREIPYNIYYSIFGLTALPFRIFIFLLHFLNAYLVYLLVSKIFKKESLSLFVAFFFGITAANVATLYYLAGGIQTMFATTFTLSTVLLFNQYLETSHTIFKKLSFLTFLLGIFSHEQAIMIPFLIVGLLFISKSRPQFKKEFSYLLIQFVTISLLFYVEVLKIGFSSSEQQYQPIFNIKTTLNSLFWYSSWALGIPETLIDFVFPGFRLNPNLLRYWSSYYRLILPSFFISVFLIFVSLIYLFIKKKGVFNKRILFFLVWFPLGLLPVLLLPLHKSTHYLQISLPAFWTIIGLIIFEFKDGIGKKSKIFSNIFGMTIFLSLFLLSTTSAILGSTNYWAAQRGKIAQKLIKDVKTEFPTLPKGAIIYFKNDPSYPVLTEEWGKSSKQASIILNGSDALQLLYKDPTLKVYYEDIDKLPGDFSNTLYTLDAKIL